MNKACFMAAFFGLSVSASAEPAAYYRGEQNALRQLSTAAGVEEQEKQAPEPIEGEAISGVIRSVSYQILDSPTAEDVADLLSGLPIVPVCSKQLHRVNGRSQSCHGSVVPLDLQRRYMETNAYIRWDQRSLSDVYNTIVPALRKENRQLAIKLWEKAQKPAAEKKEQTKGSSQNAEKDFEQAGGRDLPENKPFDERQRKYPFPL